VGWKLPVHPRFAEGFAGRGPAVHKVGRPRRSRGAARSPHN
jgi:hypothetical protein